MSELANARTVPPAPAQVAAALTDDLERIAIGAVGLTARALAVAGSDFDLTFPQWRALLLVGSNADGARVGEVAARVGVTLPATSRLLRRLERRGLTTLGIDASDRRATRVRLTERGHEVRTAIVSHRRATLEEIASRVPDLERLDLADGLRLIAAEVERLA